MAQQKQMEDNKIQSLWQHGVSSFLDEDDRDAIANFEKLLLLIDKNNPKYRNANFYIAHSYRVLLKTKGLTKVEGDRMFECYEAYFDVSPLGPINQADDHELGEFLKRKRKSRPAKQVGNWLDTSD